MVLAGLLATLPWPGAAVADGPASDQATGWRDTREDGAAAVAGALLAAPREARPAAGWNAPR